MVVSAGGEFWEFVLFCVFFFGFSVFFFFFGVAGASMGYFGTLNLLQIWQY